MSETVKPPLPSGLVAFVKRDCPTCVLVAPVLAQLARDATSSPSTARTIPRFRRARARRRPPRSNCRGITGSRPCRRCSASTNGERGRRAPSAGTAASGRRSPASTASGAELPAWRPGCGSLSASIPIWHAELRRALRRLDAARAARRARRARGRDRGAVRARLERRPAGRAADRGARAARCSRARRATPDEIVAVVPPDLVECTVEKVAINAVMAGCKPEYLPVVLAAVEAACTDEFNMHGVLATTMPVGPVIIVNGPIRRAIGMNSRHQRLRPGQPRQRDDRPRAAARGPQRRRRPARRGRPRHLRQPRQDRASASPRTRRARRGRRSRSDFGAAPGTNTVTLFAGRRAAQHRRPAVARSRIAGAHACRVSAHAAPPEAACWRSTASSSIGPEHARVFREAGWEQGASCSHGCASCCRSRARSSCAAPAASPRACPSISPDATLPKFRPGGLLHRPRGGGGGALLGHHRRLGERRDRQHARSQAIGHERGGRCRR